MAISRRPKKDTNTELRPADLQLAAATLAASVVNRAGSSHMTLGHLEGETVMCPEET